MDPDANLRQQLELAKKILEADRCDLTDTELVLAELIRTLDEWITKGGFLPARWRNRPTEVTEL